MFNILLPRNFSGNGRKEKSELMQVPPTDKKGGVEKEKNIKTS